MHLLVRETSTLDEAEAATDLRQTPGDVVVLSFSDSDLGALASAWQEMGEGRPRLRLANLARLRHPMSVDVYVEDVVAQAHCVVVRLLGGLEYWRYGVEEVAAACRGPGVALALVPGDARPDARLDELSTVPAPMLRRLDELLAQGAPANLRAALRLAMHLGGLGPDDAAPATPVPPVPPYGVHDFGLPPHAGTPLAAIVFYRSYLLAGDIAPLAALATALDVRGLGVRGLFAASLKDRQGAAFVADALREWAPAVVLNATGFSCRQDGGASPLEAAGVPVLQVVLAGSPRDAWAGSPRGLSAADLAMQVVLPELDGRLLTGAISFKDREAEIPGLEFARMVHHPDQAGIELAADRAAGWARLAGTTRSERRLALVLSDYPHVSGQLGHAVGLDSFASSAEILRLLRDEGYDTDPATATEIATALTCEPPPEFLGVEEYARLFATLPQSAQTRVVQAWGEPACEGGFRLRHVRLGRLLLAIEPARGSHLDRKASYHDPDLPPCHLYVAFQLWLRRVWRAQAVIHLGAHGALEWLPGKSVALSPECFPQALSGGVPVIYPFIVNNPGEAAAAKRRLGAVTIGHLTPPLRDAGLHGAAAELERLIDEYAAADGLDRRRAAVLRAEILERAASAGLLAESGVAQGDAEADALARLDAYLCDLKDLQIRDGLHVFGQPPAAESHARLLAALRAGCPAVSSHDLAERLDASPAAERRALVAALDGGFVAAGPAGAPTRGRIDVLPTGRNLSTIDPRGLPTRAAVALAERAADDLLRRHLQEHGEYPRSAVIDLWGSTTMRTGGEDLALALVLLGARPLWHEGSNRVSGIEVLPLAVLDRPRVDVTLRISGLFRDAFETQIALYDSAVRVIARRDEVAEYNPLAAACRGQEGEGLRRATARIFGAAPGAYGAGVTDMLARGAWDRRDELGAAYIAASSGGYGQELDGAALPSEFAARVADAEMFVHHQDHREIDLLDGSEYAAHEGGFAAAAASLGAMPALYHVDTSRPQAPRTRLVAEEIARVVRGRAANPAWIAGMMRHNYRGGAEIARAVEGLCGFAATLPARLDQQFDLVFAATLGDAGVDAFLRRENPAARADMQARLREALRRDLWRPRRNVVAALLDADP